MDKVAGIMEKYGIPGRDGYDLSPSPLTFPDGAHCRMEVSGIERPSTMKAALDEMKKRKVPLHKLICTVMGASLLDRGELREMAAMAAEEKIELIMTPGPRPLWDISRQVATPEGALSGLRMHGSDQLNHLLQDIYRCLDVGLRGFLVWDEGVLYLLNQMKLKGDLPSEVVFKVSVFAGHANAAGARVLENLGATTFNPVADLTLPQLASIRKAVKIPMDLHVYLFDSFGGFNRLMEASEMARICSPCYFKIEPGVSVGSMYKPWVSEDALAGAIREKVKYAALLMEQMEKNAPELRISAQGARDLAVPRPEVAVA